MQQPFCITLQHRHLIIFIGRSHAKTKLIIFLVETSGVLGEAAVDFTRDLGRRLCKATGEPRSREFLFQRISVAVQRGNAAAVLGTMGRRLDGWE